MGRLKASTAVRGSVSCTRARRTLGAVAALDEG